MRPKTIFEVAERVLQGDSFDLLLSEFLDEFYAAPGAELLSAAPPLLAGKLGEMGKIADAYLAATAEELARKRGEKSPDWCFDRRRELRRPWFASPLASLRAVLILESPPSFRARNLFVSENALSRA